MSVNLSAAQVANRALAETVATALRVSGLDPSCLALELTESMLVGDNEELSRDAGGAQGARRAAGPRRLRDRVLVAVLPDPPAARRAQGRPLVRRRPRHRVARHRGHRGDRRHVPGPSLRVVGEGAETEQQVAELARLGCDLVQGFHFSRPVPAAEITRMLAEGPAWLPRASRDCARRRLRRSLDRPRCPAAAATPSSSRTPRRRWGSGPSASPCRWARSPAGRRRCCSRARAAPVRDARGGTRRSAPAAA